MDVDGRCDGERDEYQRSESGNKPLRQGRIDVSLWKILLEPRAFTLSKRFKSPCEAHGMVRWGSPKTPSQIRDRRCKEGRQINCQNIRSGVEGAFGLPQKFPEISKYN